MSPIPFALSLLTAVSGTAFAQADAAPPQRVEVTGSSIRLGASAAALQATLPVQRYTEADIRRTGAASLSEFLQGLPLMQGQVPLANAVSGVGGTRGLTTASIHDLGPAYTLVLLNGRRLAPAESGTVIDLQTLPLAAVERVEVLSDGASAVYGADAIAGVVNIILRRGAEPLTLRLSASGTQAGGAGERSASLTGGWGDWQRQGWELNLGAEFAQQDPLRAVQRPYADSALVRGTFQGQAVDFFVGSSRSVPPNVFVNFRDAAGTARSVSFNPFREATGACPPDHIVQGRRCGYDYVTQIEIQPEVARQAWVGSGRLRLPGGWSLFGDAVLADTLTRVRIAPNAADFSLPISSPLFGRYVQPYLTPEQRAGVTSVSYRYRFFELGPRVQDFEAKARHAVLGLEGQAAGWALNAAFTASAQSRPASYVSGFPLAAAYGAAVAAGRFDPFAHAPGQMSAEALSVLKSTDYQGPYSDTRTALQALDVNAQRPVGALPGGPVVLSLGADWRRYGYRLQPEPAVAAGQIVFEDPQVPYDLQRHTAGAHAELALPLSRALQAQLSARHDRVSGVRDALQATGWGDTRAATTAKAALRWAVAETLVLRASVGTGFRAPSMLDVARVRTDFGVTTGVYACPFNAGFDPLGYVRQGFICPDQLQFERVLGGNPALKPERSLQSNLGAVWQATQRLELGLNHWTVRIRDAVSSASEALILGDPARYLDLFTTKAKGASGLTYVALLSAPTNIGRAETRGVDWHLAWRDRVGEVTWTARVAGTHLLASRYNLPGSTAFTDSLGRFGANSAVSFRDLAQVTVTARYGRWEHSLAVQHRSGYRDQAYSAADCIFRDAAGGCTAGALSVPSLHTADWRAEFALTPNASLAVGVRNLFDREPPLSLQSAGTGQQAGYDPRYASPLGRQGQLQFSQRF